MALLFITSIMTTVTPTYRTPAGRKPTEGQPVSHLIHALMTSKRMGHFATHSARKDTRVSVLSAGRTALMILDSVMMVLTAISPMLTAEVQVRFTSAPIVRRKVTTGSPSVTIISTKLAAASAHQTALRR